MQNLMFLKNYRLSSFTEPKQIVVAIVKHTIFAVATDHSPFFESSARAYYPEYEFSTV